MDKDLAIGILNSLRPVLQDGSYVFCSVQDLSPQLLNDALMLFREAEGITLVLPKEKADAWGLTYTYVAAWISLSLYSALDAVGITAAFSAVLAENGISCNVVAAFHHDHIFVSEADAARAMELLTPPPAALPAGPY